MNWTHEFRLSSPLEITAASRLELPEYSANSRNRARITPNGATWTGCTHEEAIELAETGWRDAPDLGLIAETIAPAETRTAHQMQHAVAGAFVDVARYLEGHPECMLEFLDEPAPRVISIAVGIGATANTSTRSMELAGAVAVAVIDTLTASGFNVELSAFVTSTDRDSSLTTFPLKRAHEPIDQNQIAFWLCHPAAFRSLIFGFWDTCPKDFYEGTSQNHGRGRIDDSTAEALGVDYVLISRPRHEEAAAASYSRIMDQIKAAI